MSDRPRDEARAVFRNAILDAAETVFAERGFHAARIQDIAKRAQIAVGTIYNHFCQKEDLLVALLEERTLHMLSELGGRPDDPADFQAKLLAQLTRMLRFIDRHRAFFSVALEHGLTEPKPMSTPLAGQRARLFEQSQAAFLQLIREGIAQRALAPIDPARLSRFLAGTIRAMACHASVDGARLEAEAPLIVSLFLSGAASAESRQAAPPPPPAPS